MTGVQTCALPIYTYQKAEPDLPLGIAAPVVGFYVDAIKAGYFLRETKS